MPVEILDIKSIDMIPESEQDNMDDSPSFSLKDTKPFQMANGTDSKISSSESEESKVTSFDKPKTELSSEEDKPKIELSSEDKPKIALCSEEKPKIELSSEDKPKPEDKQRPNPVPVNFAKSTASENFMDENKQNLTSVVAMRQTFTGFHTEMEDNTKVIRNFLAFGSFLFKTKVPDIRSHPLFSPLLKKHLDLYGSNVQSKQVPKEQMDGLEIISMVPARRKKRDLPPAGELKRKELVLGSKVWALSANLTAECVRGTILSCRDSNDGKLYKWRNEFTKAIFPKLYNAKQFAHDTSADVIVPVGSRIIARYVDKGKAAMFAGIVAEPPKITNRERYLVFFDDGYAQYVNHDDIFVVCEQSNDVANDIHETMRPFVRLYLAKYPERAMVKLQKNQYSKVELQGEWCDAKVLDVDSSMIKVQFLSSQEKEWIYRGSTRLKLLYNELANAEASRLGGKGRRHNIVPRRQNQPYVEYTREREVVTIDSDSDSEKQENNATAQHARRKTGGVQYLGNVQKPRNTARKSTGGQTRTLPQEPGAYYKPDIQSHSGFKDIHQLKSYNRVRYVSHDCNIVCREREHPIRFKGKNPTIIPIFFGWERQLRRFRKHGVKIIITYRAPCGRHLRSLEEVQKFLYLTESRITIDFFSFEPNLLIFRTFRAKDVLYETPDVTQGKENVPVSCVNNITNQPPPFVEYSSERFPGEGVFLNLDPEFLCGCDCTDNCQNPALCNCQRLTNYAKTGNPVGDAGYKHRRLKEPIVTGLYECNEKCACGPQCGNRVVQNGLQVRLQMFKTMHKGWGIRCLDDIDAGMFLCTYAGQLLTEQGADKDGNQFGDEYLAELDHIEVVEKSKEGYESDVEDMDIDDDSDQESTLKNDRDSEEPVSSDSDVNMCADSDSDFESNSLRTTASCTYATRSRQRGSKKNHSSTHNGSVNGNSINCESEKKELPDISTLLDSYPIVPRPLSPESAEIVENVEFKRRPKFSDSCAVTKKSVSTKHPTAPIMPPSLKPPKFKSIRSYYGEDSLYIMDAKSKGNIGRYLNHSCAPNAFVQNVFVDTHDLRFPTVAFFAQEYISAGAELTWDYNYEVGSVADKVMYCYCETKSCRGRLL